MNSISPAGVAGWVFAPPAVGFSAYVALSDQVDAFDQALVDRIRRQEAGAALGAQRGPRSGQERAQAVGAAYAKRWTTKTKEFDYGDKFGIATESIYGIEKLEFGTGASDTDTLKDNGVVTGWFAAVADA